MSVIPQVYNQGTGLIGSTTDGAAIPSNVEDLVVQNTLTVLGTSNFVGDVTCNSNLTVANTVSTSDLIVDGNATVDSLIVDNVTIWMAVPH